MDTSTKIDNLSGLHFETLPQATKVAFLRCATSSFFLGQGLYLAGGTALALQAGHRKSVDLDFFTPQEFDEGQMEEKLSMLGDWKTTSISTGTVYGELEKAKISLISYPFFKANKPFLQVENVSIVMPPDIAVMKVTAISHRGKKRDFFDLYWLSKSTQPLFETLKNVELQYTVKQNMNHILKSLVYFEDAEDDPDPEIYFDASWEEVKNFFEKEVVTITKQFWS